MPNQYPLLRLGDRWHERGEFQPRRRRIEAVVIPPQDRRQHGAALRREAELIRNEYRTRVPSWADREAEIRSKGIIVTIEGQPGIPLQTDAWADHVVPKFVLLNHSVAADVSGKTVELQRWFIRDGALDEFVRIFEQYLTKQKSAQSTEPKRRELVDSISRLRAAVLAELWTDVSPCPQPEDEGWYEVWLRRGDSEEDRQGILRQFGGEAVRCKFEVGQAVEKLPEHTILHVRGRFGQFGQSFALMNCLAEIRRVGDYADFFVDLTPEEQAKWQEDALKRLRPLGTGNLAVCVLDTGVNRGHPLLSPVLAAADNHTIKATWNTGDDQGHGTPMAGMAAYGNLTTVLAKNEQIPVPYILEGVKVVPPPPEVNRDEKAAAAYTAQGVATAEIAAAQRTRVWCMASTMDGRSVGRPSSWSAEIDRLAAGTDANGAVRRLFCISVGNVPKQDWSLYPAPNHESPVQNPGQAWNALCVGSCTLMDRLWALPDRKGYRTLASAYGMAPSNRTSLAWEDEWPAKPDIVLEGGNGALGPNQSVQCFPEVLPLSTSADFPKTFFELFDGTSAATALASQMAGYLLASHPDLWPETVRGLMVHSAEWTPAMEGSVPKFDADGSALTGKARLKWLLKTVRVRNTAV